MHAGWNQNSRPMAADPASLQQLALQWLRDFALPLPQHVALQLPSSTLHCAVLTQVGCLPGRCVLRRRHVVHFSATVLQSPYCLETQARCFARTASSKRPAGECELCYALKVTDAYEYDFWQVLPLTGQLGLTRLCACHGAAVQDASSAAGT